MDLINRDKKVVVSDLAEKFDLSKPTIRMDLAELQARGLIERTHGGAIPQNKAPEKYVSSKNVLELRKETYKQEKLRIAQAVKELIHDGDTIMIDGGSTTYYIVRSLRDRIGLTIITHSVFLYPLLREIPDARIYLTGGLVHDYFEDLIGDIPVKMLQQFKPDLAIVAPDAISIEDGLTSTETATARIKKQMLAVGAKSVVVADSSKFGKVSLCHVADLKDIDYLVTDNNVPPEIRDYIENTDIKLIAV